MRKKICALGMSCVLFAAMLPSTAFADAEAGTGPETEQAAAADEAADAETYPENRQEARAGAAIEEAGEAEDAEESAEAQGAEDAEASGKEAVKEPGEESVTEPVDESGEESVGEPGEENGEEPGEDAPAELPDEGDADADEFDEEYADNVLYNAEADGVIVEAAAAAGALPEGSELTVRRCAEDSPEYQEAAEAIDYESTDGRGMAALDISFCLNGEEIEPAGTVKVRIDVSAILPSVPM